MSRFVTPCDVRWLQQWEDGRQLRLLLAPLVYESDLLSVAITVPAGLVYDGQSIPRKVAGFVGNECNEAGTVHDWLYLSHVLQMGTLSADDLVELVRYSGAGFTPERLEEARREVVRFVTRQEADLVYREILLLSGMHEVDAQEQYAALDFWGDGPYATGPARIKFGRILT